MNISINFHVKSRIFGVRKNEIGNNILYSERKGTESYKNPGFARCNEICQNFKTPFYIMRIRGTYLLLFPASYVFILQASYNVQIKLL